MLVHHDHIWYVLTKLNKHNKAWKKTTYTTEQCSACHSSFWYLEVFLTVDPCVYMKYSYKIKRATNTKQTKHTHTHTTEQSVLCIIIYWHSTWRHLHRISIYNFKCCFFYFTKITVTNKQTIAKTIMTFFFTSLSSVLWFLLLFDVECFHPIFNYFVLFLFSL